MVDPIYYRIFIDYLDENGEIQTAVHGWDERADAVESMTGILNEGDYFPEGMTIQKATFCEPGVEP